MPDLVWGRMGRRRCPKEARQIPRPARCRRTPTSLDGRPGAASKRRSNRLPAQGSLGWERPEGEGPGVRKRARPRTRSRPLDCRSLPAPPSRSLRPRPPGIVRRKAIALGSFRRRAGAHVPSDGVRIGTPCRFRGRIGPDPKYCRCANHSVEDSWESTDKATGPLVISARETRPLRLVEDAAVETGRRDPFGSAARTPGGGPAPSRAPSGEGSATRIAAWASSCPER